MTAVRAGEATTLGAEELARLLAHDLRTPLNAMRGFADLLLAGAAGPLATAQIELMVEVVRAGRALETAVAAAQELGEPLPPPRSDRALEPVLLQILLLEGGFALRRVAGQDPLSCFAVADAGLWRRLLAACCAHLRVEGVAPVEAWLARGPGGRLELTMERTDISERWQMSSMRERQILRLAVAAGAAILSEAPHMPLVLRVDGSAATAMGRSELRQAQSAGS